MYRWYKNAAICYAYLVDVPTVYSVKDPCWGGVFDVRGTFGSSRWFTRGWTLQELIAPKVVEFYAEDWTEIGTKSSLREELSLVTGIDIHILDGEDPSVYNVAERMSWAAFRKTTRIEDAAYCLLGIFQVYMPLLYGEGQRAFLRLQEEVLKTAEDYTLLAWGAYLGSDVRSSIDLNPKIFLGPLAEDVFEFRVPNKSTWGYSELQVDRFPEIVLHRSENYLMADSPPMMTASGLHISLPLLKVSDKSYLAYLYCRQRQTNELLCMSLRSILHGRNQYERQFSGNCGYHFLSASRLSSFQIATMYIRQRRQHDSNSQIDPLCLYNGFQFDFKVDPIVVSDGCTVITSWGERSTNFPWTTKKVELIEDSISHEAYFLLGSGDKFSVKFGIKSWKLWCYIFLHPKDFPGPKSTSVRPKSLRTSKKEWEIYGEFVPDILRDRATKTLRSNLGEISISIRRHVTGASVNVCIN
jgi:hypothetical protein